MDAVTKPIQRRVKQMTKETIIKSTLKYLVKRQIEEGSVGFAVDNDHDHDCCWDDVLAWIEAQPCEDCISRQKALDCFEQTNTRQGAKYAIETLPSVKPKYTDEEIDKAQAVEQAYVDKMVELAVEEAKRPKGKWIEVEVRNVYATLKCSVCGRVIEPIFDFCKYSYEDIKRSYPYCHCGAYMGGGEA